LSRGVHASPAFCFERGASLIPFKQLNFLWVLATMSASRKKAIVIGAGIGGLAMAVRLAVKGYEVQVHEANAYTGGKLSAFEQEGYRFDAGPSLFTMPHFVEELFELAGKPTEHYFQYKKLDTLCHYFFEDGTRLQAPAQVEAMANQLAKTFSEDKQVVLSFFKHNAWAYQITEPLFVRGSLHTIGSHLRWATLKGVLASPFLHLFKSMNEVNQRTFKNPKTVQLFNRYATYNGSDPYQTPGLMNVIPHLEHGIGAFFPEGGMHSISQSITQLAKDLGVQFFLNSSVGRIIVENKRAKGVLIDNRRIDADLVVSNMDIMGTYRRLMPDQAAPEKLLKQERSSSALIFYWGIKKQFPELSLHNIFFSENYKEEFKALFKDKTLYKDPTVYINISSKENPSDAPEGGENWFVMINVPPNTGQDWDRLIKDARSSIINKLSKHLGLEVESHIVCESLLDPRGIEAKTSSVQGSLYGNSSNNRYAAFLRHANFSRKIKGLYFVGGSVHPGGGIPLALSSAAIADGFILKA
jgi:phytoene desaturase